MAFDFSKYTGGTTTSAPQSLGALPTGITTSDIPQMNYQLGRTAIADDPSTRIMQDSEGNPMGLYKDLNPSGYATEEAQWNEQNKLQDAGLLRPITQGNTSEGEATTQMQYLGNAAPQQLSGHWDNAGQPVYKGPLLDYIGTLNDSTGDFKNPLVDKLFNKDAVGTDPNWGKLTADMNIDKSDGGWDTFWKIAPLIPGLIAGGVGMLGLSGVGGATAGDIAAGADTGGMFGTPLANIGATGMGSMGAIPASLAKYVTNTVKSLPQQLNSGNGKFDPLSTLTSLVPGAFNLPSYVAPLLNEGVNLARGGSFDFSKYIPMGLQQIAKGLG